MLERVRARLPGWGARLCFAALLLVFSEWIIWQTPTTYGVLDWLALAVIYLALAAVMLDLIARLNVNEVFSLFLLAGVYGLANGTLISHVATSDLPLSLIGRPLAAQPLAFMGALGALLILASGRATGPLEFLIALAAGLLWGIWVRWFPVVSEANIPSVAVSTALIALGVGLVLGALLWIALPAGAVTRYEDWRLTPVEWIAAGGVLLAALAVGMAQDEISRAGLGIVITLVAFFALMLWMTARLRRGSSFLGSITPPRRPNLAAWLVLVVPFLLAGWIGYKLPGSGDSAVQSDMLFGALTGFGVVWPPVVSTVIGVRAFVRLAREGG